MRGPHSAISLAQWGPYRFVPCHLVGHHGPCLGEDGDAASGTAMMIGVAVLRACGGAFESKFCLSGGAEHRCLALGPYRVKMIKSYGSGVLMLRHILRGLKLAGLVGNSCGLGLLTLRVGEGFLDLRLAQGVAFCVN